MRTLSFGRLESSGRPMLGDKVTILRICEFMLSTSWVVGRRARKVVQIKQCSLVSNLPEAAASSSSRRKVASNLPENASTPCPACAGMSPAIMAAATPARLRHTTSGPLFTSHASRIGKRPNGTTSRR